MKPQDKLETVAKGRFTFLLIAMFAFIVLHPLMVEEGLRGRAIANLFFFAIVMSSLRAVYRRRSLRSMVERWSRTAWKAGSPSQSEMIARTAWSCCRMSFPER